MALLTEGVQPLSGCGPEPPRAQGCCTQLPWGIAEMIFATPTGLRRCSTWKTQWTHETIPLRPIPWFVLSREAWPQPRWGWRARRPRSQGSRVQQPGAGGRIPFGKNVQTL